MINLNGWRLTAVHRYLGITDGTVFSPFLRCHNFSSILLWRVAITRENLKAAVSGKHPQIHKHLHKAKVRFSVDCDAAGERNKADDGKDTYMLLEELFLSFCLVQKQIPGPVSRYQSSESFLQVVVFLETLDELLQLLLSSLDWTKPAVDIKMRHRTNTNEKIWH